MAVRKRWPVAVGVLGVLGVLTACGGVAGSGPTVGQVPAASPADKQSGPPDDVQQPVTVDFAPDEVQVLRENGAGETALPVFRSGSCRVLVSCRGEPLQIRDARREIAKTTCDGVTLDARVASAAGTKGLTVVASAPTAWTIRVARTGDDWFKSKRPD